MFRVCGTTLMFRLSASTVDCKVAGVSASSWRSVLAMIFSRFGLDSSMRCSRSIWSEMELSVTMPRNAGVSTASASI